MNLLIFIGSVYRTWNLKSKWLNKEIFFRYSLISSVSLSFLSSRVALWASDSIFYLKYFKISRLDVWLTIKPKFILDIVIVRCKSSIYFSKNINTKCYLYLWKRVRSSFVSSMYERAYKILNEFIFYMSLGGVKPRVCRMFHFSLIKDVS